MRFRTSLPTAALLVVFAAAGGGCTSPPARAGSGPVRERTPCDPGADEPVPSAAASAEAAAPAAEPAADRREVQVLCIYDVHDLVSAAGGPGGAADLAVELHAAATYRFGDADPELSISSRGGTIVVRAQPRVQKWIDHSLRERRMQAPVR